MTEKKSVGAPRKTPDGGQRVTFYLPRDVTAWIRENGGSRWIRQQAYKAMEKKEIEETKMNKQIEKLVREYREKSGIALYLHDNGQPNYFDAKTMCDFAMVSFENYGSEYVAVLHDDGNKRENIISVDQLEELISKQTENRGNFYETKADALTDLNYMLNSENIDKDTYDELVQELNKLKI
ncbi:hypothetical protein [Parasutterella sp.]|uniref:hypothetical protein n=1 Tax=Parasutterella sp. TaxID=2049037 RepID=UPI00307B27DF